jgi:hypothetical protein
MDEKLKQELNDIVAAIKGIVPELQYYSDEFERKSQKRSMLAYTIKKEGVVLGA